MDAPPPDVVTAMMCQVAQEREEEQQSVTGTACTAPTQRRTITLTICSLSVLPVHCVMILMAPISVLQRTTASIAVAKYIAHFLRQDLGGVY